MKAVLLISFILLISGSSAFWLTPRAAFDKCTESGLVCSEDCRTVEYCPEASKPSVTVRECPSSTFCSKNSGMPECDAKSCPSAKPLCPGPGAIPSATDCHIYFLCSGPGDSNPLQVPCGNDVFNTVTLKCDASLECRTPVLCPKAGDNGFIDPDTKIFCYYCSEVNTPYVYPC